MYTLKGLELLWINNMGKKEGLSLITEFSSPTSKWLCFLQDTSHVLSRRDTDVQVNPSCHFSELLLVLQLLGDYLQKKNKDLVSTTEYSVQS